MDYGDWSTAPLLLSSASSDLVTATVAVPAGVGEDVDEDNAWMDFTVGCGTADEGVQMFLVLNDVALVGNTPVCDGEIDVDVDVDGSVDGNGDGGNGRSLVEVSGGE